MEVGLLDGGEDGKYSGVGFVDVSEISAMQGAFFFESESFDRIYDNWVTCTNTVL